MSLINNIKGFVTNADIYSQPIDFTYRESKSFSTTCGGCVSIFLGGILILYSIFLIYRTFTRDYPIVVSNDSRLDTPLLINIIKDISFNTPAEKKIPIQSYLKNTTFYLYLAFGIQDNLNNLALQVMDPSYYTLSINEISNRSNVLITKPLNFLLCKKFGEFESQFKKLNLSYTYCIYDSYGVFGKAGSDFSKISISVSKCVNSSAITCRSIQEINKKVENFKMTLYYSAEMLNLTNYENPVAITFKNQYWDLVSTWKKNSVLTLSVDKLSSYDTIFPSSLYPYSNSFYALRTVSFVDSVQKIGNDSVFFNLDIISGDYSTQYRRSYSDIFAQISEVGGIANILMPLGFIFVYYFAIFRTEESLSNDFYNIISPENNKNINLPFEDFIKQHYNYLINKQLKDLKEESKLELKIEVTLRKKQEEEDLDVSSFLNDNQQENTNREKNITKKKNKKKSGFIAKILQRIKTIELKKLQEKQEEIPNINEDKDLNKSQIKNNSDRKEVVEMQENIKENKLNEIELQQIPKDNIINKQDSKSNQINLSIRNEKNNVNEEEKVNKIDDEKGAKETVAEEIKMNNEPGDCHISPKIDYNESEFKRKEENDENNETNNVEKVKRIASQNKEKSLEMQDKNSDSEEEEEEVKPLNGLEKYLTKDIIEKIYGLKTDTVKEEIKNIIKQKINDKNKSLFMSRRKSKEIKKARYEKFKKLFNKSMKSNMEEIEMQIEEIRKDELEQLKLDEGMFEKVISRFPRNELEFQKYKILYNLVKYEINDKIEFGNHEILLNLFCFLCLQNKANNYYKKKKKIPYGKNIKDLISKDYEVSLNLLKKHKVFEITRKKLSYDLDIINVLKTTRDFEKFKNIFFDKTQIDLFESETKPTITEDDNYSKLYNFSKKINTINTTLIEKKKTLVNSKNIGSRSLNFVGTTSFINVDVINFDDNVDEGESDFKKIRVFDKLLSFIIDKNEIDLKVQKMLLNMGIQIEEIIIFNQLIKSLGSIKNNENHEKEIKKRDEDHKMKEAYPNIFQVFFKSENPNND